MTSYVLAASGTPTVNNNATEQQWPWLQYHQPTHLHNIVGQGLNIKLSADASSTQHRRPQFECTNNSLSIYETTADIVSMKEQWPQHIWNNNGYGIYTMPLDAAQIIYKTTLSAARTQHCRSTHLRDMIGRGSNPATTIATVSAKQQQPRHLYDNNGRGSNKKLSTTACMWHHWPRLE